MKRQQYTLSLGVCASCHGNPVLEFDSTWSTFSASLCECKEKSCEFNPMRGRDYHVSCSLLYCSNCGIDLEKANRIDGPSEQFGNFCSKGCAAATAIWTPTVYNEIHGGE